MLRQELDEVQLQYKRGESELIIRLRKYTGCNYRLYTKYSTRVQFGIVQKSKGNRDEEARANEKN